jgi:hypothetical protein
MSAQEPEHHTEKLTESIGKWIEKNTTPEFRDFKRKQVRHTLADDLDRELGLPEMPREFVFSKEVEKEHALIMSFLNLHQSAQAFSQCEYYFRRFPFRGLPISRHEHLRNVCELYFSMFYVIRSRLKMVLNEMKFVCPGYKMDVGAFIKLYDKEFDQELRERNSVHHSMPFRDLAIDRIMLTEMMASTGKFRNKGWDKEHLVVYRKSSKEWADRVKRRSVAVRAFIDAVAKAILDVSSFLKT